MGSHFETEYHGDCDRAILDSLARIEETIYKVAEQTRISPKIICDITGFDTISFVLENEDDLWLKEYEQHAIREIENFIVPEPHRQYGGKELPGFLRNEDAIGEFPTKYPTRKINWKGVAGAAMIATAAVGGGIVLKYKTNKQFANDDIDSMIAHTKSQIIAATGLDYIFNEPPVADFKIDTPSGKWIAGEPIVFNASESHDDKKIKEPSLINETSANKTIEYLNITNQTNQPEIQESNIVDYNSEEKYNPHIDPKLKDAKFKNLYVFVTPETSKQFSGQDNIEKGMEDIPRYMNSVLKRFNTGIAIENVKIAEIAEFKNHDAREVVFNELNTEYGCRYLREKGIEPRNALFLGLVDEKTWNNFTDKNQGVDFSKHYGIGYEDGGGLIKILPGMRAIDALDILIVHEVIGHGWGLPDREDIPRDLMNPNDYRGGGSMPSSFADAWKIAENPDKKVNTC